jgi:hypothetical protein
MQNSPVLYHSLGESLLSQVALIELDVRRRALLEFLCSRSTRAATCPSLPRPWPRSVPSRERHTCVTSVGGAKSAGCAALAPSAARCVR